MIQPLPLHEKLAFCANLFNYELDEKKAKAIAKAQPELHLVDFIEHLSKYLNFPISPTPEDLIPAFTAEPIEIEQEYVTRSKCHRTRASGQVKPEEIVSPVPNMCEFDINFGKIISPLGEVGVFDLYTGDSKPRRACLEELVQEHLRRVTKVLRGPLPLSVLESIRLHKHGEQAKANGKFLSLDFSGRMKEQKELWRKLSRGIDIVKAKITSQPAITDDILNVELGHLKNVKGRLLKLIKIMLFRIGKSRNLERVHVESLFECIQRNAIGKTVPDFLSPKMIAVFVNELRLIRVAKVGGRPRLELVAIL